MLPMHKESGVFLLAPSKKIIMSVNESERLLGALNPAFGVMFIDSTPGVKEDCNIGAQNRATVTIINAEYNTNEFFYDLLSIRDDMNEGEGEASGLFERLVAEKRLFIEVNSVPKAKFNRRTQYEIAKKLEIENEQVILVPYEYQIKEKSPVRRAAVSQRYLYAVSESARTLTEAAAAYNRNNPWDGPVRRIKESPARQRNRAVDRLIDLHDGIADDAAKAVLKRKLGS